MKNTNTNTATVRFNKEQGGIELVFPSAVRLGLDEQEVLKAKGFRWHRKNKYYYARYNEETMAWVRKVFPSTKLPKKDEDTVKKVAKKKAEEAPKRKTAKKETQSARLDRIEQMLLALAAEKGVGV